MKKRIAFYSFQMGLRGTEVTMYDFAHYNETILGNESVIIYPKNNPRNHNSAIEKFSKRFDKIFTIEGDGESDPKSINEQLNILLKNTNCSHFYMQKKGINDNIFPTVCRTLILCCGIVDPFVNKHGDKYAFISQWLSDVCSGGKIPVVPSIVDLPNIDEDFRNELKIPKDAIVLGRTGGEDTWNIPWTNDVIKFVLNKRPNIYFLFQNTPKFYQHERLINIPCSANLEFKVKFINTADAMLHSRQEGESFGVTCGEFSLRNKQIITYGHSPERNHINILGDKAIYFYSQSDLAKILMNYVPDKSKDYNCYRQFNPIDVMKKFNEVFLHE